VQLDDEWVWPLIEQAEDVSFTNDLLHPVHVAVSQFLGRDRAIVLRVHHDLVLVYDLHCEQLSVDFVPDLQHLGECSLSQNLEQRVVLDGLLSD
jgi:hypothetical protein